MQSLSKCFVTVALVRFGSFVVPAADFQEAKEKAESLRQERVGLALKFIPQEPQIEPSVAQSAAAVRAHPPDEVLGDDAQQRAGHEVPVHAEVQERLDRLHRA